MRMAARTANGRMPLRRQCGALAIAALAAAILAGCGSTPAPRSPADTPPGQARSSTPYFALDDEAHAREMVLFALGLLDTGYRFGGRNPEAGLDCSGMVAWIVENISGKRLPHNAAQIADRTRPIKVSQLQPGDLVFFNTLKRRHSHMGIYIGEGRFVHAPSSRGSVRVERLDNRYFAPRIDGARTLVASN
ncbi:C40 family peptidase [Thauera linaloolentis]|uniref:NLP/P60 protein n=2 Tax=Thauera linaloolentis TaxID=76112 RepID=N6Z7I2_THAL4|nr:NLP/P60 protein [Thauera linaloolentis 47Lol = DSM 12138]